MKVGDKLEKKFEEKGWINKIEKFFQDKFAKKPTVEHQLVEDNVQNAEEE